MCKFYFKFRIYIFLSCWIIRDLCGVYCFCTILYFAINIPSSHAAVAVASDTMGQENPQGGWTVNMGTTDQHGNMEKSETFCG